MNGVYLRNLPAATFMERCRPFFPEGAFDRCRDKLVQIADLVKERIKLLPEVPEMVEFLYSDAMTPDFPACLKQGVTSSIAGDIIEAALPGLQSLEDFTSSGIEGVLRPLVDRFGLKVGAIFGVFRISVLGKSVTPPLFESIAALGRTATIHRLESAVSHFRGNP
jgi:glutamyl-tRNA synthetase